MGLHQDRDETDLTAPVVSVSLGDDALFRLGGTTRQGPTRSLLLRSGDVVVLGGAGAPELPRHRPGAVGHLGPRAGRRPDQPDAAPGDGPLKGGVDGAVTILGPTAERWARACAEPLIPPTLTRRS